MNDVHGTHSTSCIVEHPFLLVAQVLRANLLLQLGNNVIDDGARIFAMGFDCTLGEIVQVVRFEDVELLQARVEEAVDSGEESEEDRQEAETPDRETAARGLVGRFGGHGEWDRETEERAKQRRGELYELPLARNLAIPGSSTCGALPSGAAESDRL